MVVVGRIVLEDFLGVGPNLGAYSSCNVVSHLLPVFTEEADP